MLPRSRRISRAEDFRSVTRLGRRAATRTVVVHVGPLAPDVAFPAGTAGSTAHSPARAGFVVGRSVSRSAVLRNRVTRRLRHITAARLEDLPNDLGVVVRALPAAAGASTEELTADVASALRRCIRSLGHDAAPASAVSS